MRYDDFDDDYNESVYQRMLDSEREELEATKVASKEHHDYREVMYRKEDVAAVEKQAILEILAKDPNLAKYPDPFIQKAIVYFPELADEAPKKNRRGKKSNMYFLETVGRHLWEKWNADKSPENQNDFVLYLCTIIDGVIFKYGRHKHGLSYGEIFQGAIVRLIQSMDKFDPARIVGTDDYGRPIYARVYTYFTMILNYGITSITMAHGGDKIRNLSYDDIMCSYGVEDSATDAPMIYQEFLIYLNVYRNQEHLTPVQSTVANKLYDLLSDSTRLASLSNNVVYTLQTECKLKSKDVAEALSQLSADFGPLSIFSSNLHRVKGTDYEKNSIRNFEN